MTQTDGAVAAPPDLSICESEPIHLLGGVQPHGALIALKDDASLTIMRVSANAGDVLGLEPAAMLGQPFAAMFGDVAAVTLLSQDLSPRLPNVVQPFKVADPVGRDPARPVLDVDAHRHSGEVFVEFTWPNDEGRFLDGARARTLNAQLPGLMEAEAEAGVADLVTQMVRRITGYDRVMMYRFRDDWSGEVMSETQDGQFESYMGLRFPASDIPAQARELYRSSVLRVIVDVDAEPVGVVSAPGMEGPLDLSYAHLRSVSPVHIEYLRNMGVRASLSVSLVVEGRLWGLIACHHHAPRLPDAATLANLRQLSWIVSAWLALSNERRKLRYDRFTQGLLDEVRADSAEHADCATFIAQILGEAARALGADDYAGWCCEAPFGATARAGVTPAEATRAFFAKAGGAIIHFQRDETASAFINVDPYAGVAAFGLTGEPDDLQNWVAFLFHEQMREVRWAGDPYKPAQPSEDGMRISPRQSFAAWVETERGRSIPLTEEKQNFVMRLQEAMGDWLRRRNGHRAQRQARLLATALEASPQGVVITEIDQPDARVIYVNAAVSALTGHSADEARALGRRFLFGPETELSALSVLNAAFLANAPRETTLRLHRKDGAAFPARLALAPVADADGRVFASVMMFSDLTAERQREEQLSQAQRMDTIGYLTGAVAHDFNNILASITLNLGALKATLPPDSEEGVLAKDSLEAAERGADLTARLLTFARRRPLAPEPLDLNALILGMRVFLRRVLGNAFTVNVHESAQPMVGLVDRVQLESAILNLALNARDAYPDKGEIDIGVRGVTREDTPIGAEPGADRLAPGEYVEITVSDRAGGMADAVVARAFEPFFTTKAIGRGTGLGLSMVYGFARQSGGEARIENRPGEGVTVTLLLPYKPVVAEPHAPPAAKETQTPLAGASVLLVEDDDLVRDAGGRALEAMGLRVARAETFEEAIAKAGDGGGLDMLITDIGLPEGRTGFEVADAINLHRPDLPVLFITGEPRDRMAEAVAARGEERFLWKPFSLAELRVRVSRLIARR